MSHPSSISRNNVKEDGTRPQSFIAVYLTEQEASQIIAISEKQGILGSVVRKIYGSKSTKNIK